MIQQKNEGWPKWPGLLVTGESISEEQASEILIRTQRWYLLEYDISKNSLLYDELHKIYVSSFPIEDRISHIPIDYDIIEDKIQRLELSYLHNDRISSSWVGGLHGWCNWDGKIFCNNYNIGKWPKIEEVEEDLKLIAFEFSFLNFTLQLLSQEIHSEEDYYPIYTCEVKDGSIKQIQRDDFICSISDTFDSHKELNLKRNWINNKKHVSKICNGFKKYFLNVT
jgi:hypothetical protein